MTVPPILCQKLKVPDPDLKTDRDLLKDFSERGSHAAFAELVKRHGPMVHGVSRRVLSNHHDAEDVTQAVFLTLAREAAKLGRRASVAGWLHTVSRRLSLNARSSRESRQHRETAAMNESMNATPDAALSAGFRRELDAALERLPDHYRQPLVLFHLEGASLQETARRLDLHPGTLRTRLSRARDLLRQTLTRRGVEVASVGLLSALFTAEAKAAPVSLTLLGSVADAVTRGGSSVAPRVLELAEKATFPHFSPATFTILVKTNATLISATALVIAAVGTTAFLVSPGTRDPQASALPPQPAPARTSARPEVDPLSRISTKEQFEALVESVLLIEDDAERLAAMRDSLEMGISGEVYREAVAAHGYQIDPLKLFARVMGGWAKDDPRAVTLWARRFSGEIGAKLLQESFLSWLMEDEAAAMAWAAGSTLGPDLVAAAREDLGRWKKEIEAMPRLPESSAETSEMLRGMHERIGALYAAGPEATEDRSRLMRQLGSLLQRWADRDAKAAVEFSYSLHPSSRNLLGEVIVIRDFIRKWAHIDPDAALEWAKDVDHPQERAAALAAVLPSWRIKYPDRSIGEAVDLSEIPDRRYQTLIQDLASDWGATDPSAAMDFAMSLEDPDLKGAMVAKVMDSWVRKDAEEARQWVASLPPGPVRDASLGELGVRISRTDFRSANRLVREIEDPEVKEYAIVRVMTISDAIERHLEDALKLADDGMSRLDLGVLRSWAGDVAPEDVPVFTAWLERARDAGRMQFAFAHIPADTHPAERLRLEEEAAAKQYRFVLGGLKHAPEHE